MLVLAWRACCDVRVEDLLYGGKCHDADMNVVDTEGLRNVLREDF